MVSPELIRTYLQEVSDPEIPVLTINDLGVVQQIYEAEGEWVIELTPTYSGCPAMQQIEADVLTKLQEKGITNARIQHVLSPAWTTDWIGPEAREKLRAYGIAPPGRAEPQGLITLARSRVAVPCPFCRSNDTRLQSEFGSTACKAIHVCNSCRQPFDEFKAL